MNSDQVETGGAVPAPAPVPPTAPARSWPPPVPPALKVVGGIGIALGAITAVLNLVLPAVALPQLLDNAGAEPALWTVLIGGGACVLLGLLQLAGGIGLFRGRLWGRSLSIVAAVLSLPVVLAAAVAGRVVSNLIDVQGGVARGFEVCLFGPFGLGPFALALPIVLLTEDVRRWAAELRAGPGADPVKLEAAARLNALAVVSLLLSLVPLPPLPLAAPVIAVLALRHIAASGGKERGRGLAIAGLVVSGLWWLLAVGLAVFVVLIVTGVVR